MAGHQNNMDIRIAIGSASGRVQVTGDLRHRIWPEYDGDDPGLANHFEVQITKSLTTLLSAQTTQKGAVDEWIADGVTVH